MTIPEGLTAVRAVLLDVDGVLTDGRLNYGPDGEAIKSFNVKDGLGIRRLIEGGIAVAIISGRSGKALEKRASDLGITHVEAGVKDKRAAVAKITAALGVNPGEALAVGDDLPDLAMFDAVGLGACPSDAHADVRAAATWITSATGGAGVVREISDAILATTAEPSFRVIIPARYDSTRLPGKPLRMIADKPMIQHVWDRAIESGASGVIVATDDERIATCVRGFGGNVEMTDRDHVSGTDRVAEVARKRGFGPRDIVVNLQGDEPAMPSHLVAKVASALTARPWMSIATLATPIDNIDDVFDPNTVKAVVDPSGRALLFSRAPIPWDREHFEAGKPAKLPEDSKYLRHLGLYAYRVADLAQMSAAAPAVIEQTERLEQLRALSLRLDIHVSIVKKAPPSGVDIENDLERIARFF